MPDATPDVVAIENYITGVINQDASTVAEVAQVAAQTAVSMSGLTVPMSDTIHGFLEKLSAYHVKNNRVYWLKFMTDLRAQYADSTLTPVEMLDEVIATQTEV